MKLTIEELKQIIREELQEAHRDKYGQPKSFSMTRDRMARDIYHRTNPEFTPSPDGDYKPDPSRDTAKAQANTIITPLRVDPNATVRTDDIDVFEELLKIAKKEGLDEKRISFKGSQTPGVQK